MVTIVTRAGKGAALTWTEGDANITNLNTGKLENVVEDTTPQLGGQLDVNGNAIVSASNGNIVISPNGSGNISLTPATGKIILGALDFPTGMGTNGQVLTTNGSSALSFTTISSGATNLDGLSDVVITAAASNDVLVYNGTNWVDTAANTLTVSAASTATTATTATNVTIVATGTDTTMYPVVVGALAGSQIPYADIDFKWDASANILVAPTVNATNFNGIIGATTAAAGTFTTLTSTGRTVLKDLTETVATVTYASTITPDVANGTVQKVTLTGNVTFSAFANPVTGQSLTLFVTQDGTGSKLLTSTMKFSGASKTLSTAANSIDIITVFYDGTNYYASLAKGFA